MSFLSFNFNLRSWYAQPRIGSRHSGWTLSHGLLSGRESSDQPRRFDIGSAHVLLITTVATHVDCSIVLRFKCRAANMVARFRAHSAHVKGQAALRPPVKPLVCCCSCCKFFWLGFLAAGVIIIYLLEQL